MRTASASTMTTCKQSAATKPLHVVLMLAGQAADAVCAVMGTTAEATVGAQHDPGGTQLSTNVQQLCLCCRLAKPAVRPPPPPWQVP